MTRAAAAYTYGWREDASPRWDDDRARVFATVPDDLFPSALRRPGRRLPGRWWRITDEGAVVAHCWLHEVGGKPVALLAVEGGVVSAGPSGFGTVRLGEEAVARGFDRVTDECRRVFPEQAAVTTWVLRRSVVRPAVGHGPG